MPRSNITLGGQELKLDADADTSITVDTDDTIDVKVGGTDTVKVTGTQTDVKVSASRELNILKDGSDDALVLQSSAPDASNNLRRIELAGEIASFSTGASSGTSATERMRILDDGNSVFGGTTAAINDTNSDEKVVIEGDGEVIVQGAAKVLLYLNRNQTNGEIVSLRQGNNAKGGISVAASSVAFNTSSDYRLKENVTTSWDATTRLKQLKPSRFSWKIEGKSEADTEGFLAHEVSSVVPQATQGVKDEVVTQDGIDDGTYPKDAKVGDAHMQSIDHSKLVPLLVKTIQELEARIATLESK